MLRTMAALATLLTAAALTAPSAPAEAPCGHGTLSGGQLTWCKVTNGWGQLEAFAQWGGSDDGVAVQLLRNGQQNNMTVYLDQADHPNPAPGQWAGWVARGKGFANKTSGLRAGLWFRGCATDDNQHFMCTGWTNYR